MPTPVVMIPPTNQIDTMSDDQPLIVVPKKYSTIPKIIIQNAIKVIPNPIKVINFRGATENDVMPSIEKESILCKGYLDSPAVLCVLL